MTRQEKMENAAWNAYRAACESARKICDEACAAAMKTYDETVAAAGKIRDETYKEEASKRGSSNV